MSMLIPRLFILVSNWAGRLRQVGEFLSGTDLLGLENVGKKIKESLTRTTLAVNLGKVFVWIAVILGRLEGDFPLASTFLWGA